MGQGLCGMRLWGHSMVREEGFEVLLKLEC